MMRKIPTSHKGRKCKHEGCKQILSVYNHNTYCHAHMGRMSLAARFQTSFDKKEAL